MEKLRIAQVASPWYRVPPLLYGGTEFVVHYLTEELVKRGHEVTLFAPGDSQTSACLIPTLPNELYVRGQEQRPQCSSMHETMASYYSSLAFVQAQRFDIIHNHFFYYPLLFSSFTKTPSVHTYHTDFLRKDKNPQEKAVLEKFSDANWIAISHNQQQTCPIGLRVAATIHHGVPVEQFPFSNTANNYLVWLGRITKEKGILDAIQVAYKTQVPLILAGIVHEQNKLFYDQYVKPQIDNQFVFYAGALSFVQKVQLLLKARALLFPVSWEEPFGLVMLEAMSCGTPVIGYSYGSVPEVVIDGQTGYIINRSVQEKRGEWRISTTGVDGLCQAVEQLRGFSYKKYRKMRQATRAHVESNFSSTRMADNYEQLYQRIINNNKIPAYYEYDFSSQTRLTQS